MAAMVAAARSGDIAKAARLYQRFLRLIVFEQQPGVAVRKELQRRQGLLDSATVRHRAVSCRREQSTIWNVCSRACKRRST